MTAPYQGSQGANDIMSITIIHGPHAHRPNVDLLQQLQQRVTAAGQTLEWCPCRSLADLVATVRATKPCSTEFVLLDPGELACQARNHPEAGLGDAIEHLGTPYVEVHEKSDSELEHPAGSRHGPVATVIIHGDIGNSYLIGLGIALRQLSAQPMASAA
jgi:3-dehydroquinate dehydratase-2